MPKEPLTFTMCETCHGDPIASLHCRVCHGAGVFASASDGPIVWLHPLTGFAFRFRSFSMVANAVFHLVCLFLSIGSIVWAIVDSVQSFAIYDSDPLLNVSFLLGRPLLWFGCLLGCFTIFRLSAYSGRPVPLPGWANRSRSAKKTLSVEQVVHAPLRDISVHFQSGAWAVLSQAYQLASRVHRARVEPIHLFAAAISGPAGGVFLSRLGIDFSRLKEGMVALLRRGNEGDSAVFSIEAKQVLLSAYMDAVAVKRQYVGPMELFTQSFLAEQGIQELFDHLGFPAHQVLRVADWVRLQERLREERDRFIRLARMKPNTMMNRTMTARQTPLLNRLSEDLTLAARNGYIPPLVGREDEMEALLRALESGRPGVALVGENGSGKSAIVEGLARRMVEEDVPEVLFDKRLVSIHVAALLGAGDPSRMLERLLGVLREAAMSGNIILVLEGVDALAGAGGQGTMDLAETLASELEKRYCTVIATATPSAWTAYIERRTLGSKLAKVEVPDPSDEDAIRVLMAKSGSIEYENRAFFSYGSIEKAVQFARRYLHDEHLPESALIIAKEAAVLAGKEEGEWKLVTDDHIAEIVQQRTHIPLEAVSRDETEKLLHLETKLHERVIGQDEAVVAVAQAMRRARADMREQKRPIANFLFLGPTGVGKTELAKSLAAEYFGSENAMIRLDMSEYQHPSSVARIIGSPGDERGGLLTEAVRKQPFSIVLLDELEKAHADILTLFLQVMDDGRLTDGVGKTADFTNTVLIATSNAGTGFIQEQIASHVSMDQIKTALIERELKATFRPEFLNRFDAIIVFKPLQETDVMRIAELMIGSIAKRLAEKGMGFRADSAAVQMLAKAGFDPLFGARPLRRVLQERVENALADLLLRKAVERRDTIVLDPDGAMRVERGTFSTT